MSQLRALMLQHQTGVFGQLLELDIASQGKDVEEATIRLLLTIRFRLEIYSQEHGCEHLAADLPYAPEWIRTAYEQVAAFAQSSVIRLQDILPKDVFEHMHPYFPYEEVAILALDLRT